MWFTKDITHIRNTKHWHLSQTWTQRWGSFVVQQDVNTATALNNLVTDSLDDSNHVFVRFIKQTRSHFLFASSMNTQKVILTHDARPHLTKKHRKRWLMVDAPRLIYLRCSISLIQQSQVDEDRHIFGLRRRVTVLLHTHNYWKCVDVVYYVKVPGDKSRFPTHIEVRVAPRVTTMRLFL